MAQLHEGRWAFGLLADGSGYQPPGHLSMVLGLFQGEQPPPALWEEGEWGPPGRHEAASYKARNGRLVKCECAGLDPLAPELTPCTCGEPPCHVWDAASSDWEQELFEKKNTHVQCTDGCDYVSCSHQTEMILLFFKYAIIFTANCEMLKLFMMVDKMSALLKLWGGASGFIDLPNKSCMGDPRWLVKIVNLH